MGKEFHVNDKVKVIKIGSGIFKDLLGKEGIVIAINAWSEFPYRVKFDKSIRECPLEFSHKEIGRIESYKIDSNGNLIW